MLSILLVTGCSAKTQSSDNTQSKNESVTQEQTSNTTSPEDTNTKSLSGTYTNPVVIDTSGQVILTLSNADLESIDIRTPTRQRSSWKEQTRSAKLRSEQ